MLACIRVADHRGEEVGLAGHHDLLGDRMALSYLVGHGVARSVTVPRHACSRRTSDSGMWLTPSATAAIASQGDAKTRPAAAK